MESLNRKLKDRKWVEKLFQGDPEYAKGDNYLITGNSLKSEFKCLALGCKLGVDLGKGQPITDAGGKTVSRAPSYIWVFCFSCNRIFHLNCTGFKVEELKGKTLSAPCVCGLCVAEENNANAKEFVESGAWNVSMRKRREFFLKVVDLTDDLNTTTDGFEDAEASYAEKYNNQRQEFEKLARKLGEFSSERQSSEYMIRKQQEEINQMKNQLKEFESMKTQMQVLRSQLQNASVMEETKMKQGESSGLQKGVGSLLSSTMVPTNLPVLTVDDVLSSFYLNNTESTSSLGNTSRDSDSFAHVRSQQSFVEGINVNELSRAERITLEQVQAQLATSASQREISTTMNLEIVRKALPKITHFDGDAKRWIKFKQDVYRYREVGKYKDDVLKLHIMQALQGVALARVQDIMDTTSFEVVMKILEESFGEPTKIIDKCNKEILSIKLSKDLYKEDVMLINTKIQAYFSACKYANVPYANSNQLARHIFDQLSLTYKQLFRHQFRLSHPNIPSRLIDLESLFAFLEELARDLEDKRTDDKKAEDKRYKAAQVNVAAVVNTTRNDSVFRNSEDFMYEIKDKNSSPLGYDMNALNLINKYCLCCSRSGHFVVQCRKYRNLDSARKLQFVIETNLCRNCLITSSHRAMDCNLKDFCGFKYGNDRCNRKHHITLHKAYNNENAERPYVRPNGGSRSARNNRSGRRNNTNRNQQRAANILSQGAQNNNVNVIPNGNVSPIAQNAQNPTTSNTVSNVISQAPTISQVQAATNNQRQGTVNQAASGNAPQGCGSRVMGINIIPAIETCQYFSLGMTDIQRTVKVFKNKFLGENSCVVGHSIGDSGAEVTLMNDELRKQLGLNGVKSSLSLQWTDGSVKSVDAIKVDLIVQGVLPTSEKILLRNCYAIPDLILPPRSLNMDNLKRRFPYLRPVEFESYDNASPQLLIGSPHAAAIESMGKLLEGGEGKPVGLLAKLGWCVYGGCPEEKGGLIYGVELVNTNDVMERKPNRKVTNDDLFDLLDYFSSIESLGVEGKLTHNTELEQKALDIILEEMKTLPDGSIELPLVWNRQGNVIPRLPDNFKMVYKRQLAQEAKLNKNPIHLKAFNDNFKELIEEGYVREVMLIDMNGEWPNVNYLPMSLVINSNKDPPKYRNVFDASARFQGTSLNENLLKGPDLLVSLVKPLLRMRMNKIAFTADIKAMFMRMRINLRDQQCQRIMWRESADEEMKVFIVQSMLFGPTCSPFASQFVKNYVADLWSSRYPHAAETIKNFMYMDDLLTSEESLEKAIEIARQCIEIFGSVNWNLISFQSNNVAFLKALPHENVKQGLIPLLEHDNEACTKVLGCMWDTRTDCFVFKFDKNLFVKLVQESQHRPTKRDQCSTVARIFDVLGLISHFTIRGKILLQRSSLAGLDWDQEISEEDHRNWMDWINEIGNIAKVKIKRLYNDMENLSRCDKVELHTFCDAGGQAYAAVSYLVTTIRNDRSSHIVMAKAKVTPIRHKSRTQISEIPRLELCACLIAARLARTISEQYTGIINQRFFWSDSEVVLRWILNPNHRLLKYAISPVDEILTKSVRTEWRYVPTKLNVADIATKFRKFDFGDSGSIWYKGPSFLRMKEEHWPAMPNFAEPPLVASVKKVRMVNVHGLLYMSTQKLPPVDCPILADYLIDKLRPSILSSWTKLIRAVARGLKIWYDGFFPLLKSYKWNDTQVRRTIKEFHEGFEALSANDRERAEHFLIRKAQREGFAREYEALKHNGKVENSEFKQLNVFMDSEGLIRINSRVCLGEGIYPQRFAPVLPRKNAVTRVFLTYVHELYKHICVESQIAYVRSKYWIPQLRTTLKSIQYHCNHCNLKRAKPYAPMMAPLPDFRTNPNQLPFETTGLDGMGPFTITNYNRTKKVWVLIFVCTLTRFIHLHIIESLESIKVLEAIVQFWACHGPVKTFVSDRGTNFVGASNVIKEDKKQTLNFLREQHKVLNQQLIEKYSVEWKLLPAHSPWMGAFYERLIKEVKRSIESALETRKLNKSVLNIGLQDAAHRINNRPLTHNAVTAEDEPIITPHHLAKGRSGWPYLPGLPESNPADISQDRSIYKRGRALADEFMRRFFRNYLPTLTKRTKWFKDEKPLKVDDLVLLIEPNDTRKEWKRGRVINLYKGKDGRKRVADIILADGTVKRSRAVQRLAKIEITRVEDS